MQILNIIGFTVLVVFVGVCFFACYIAKKILDNCC